MYKVGIVGSEGYSVGELVQPLGTPPDVQLEMIYSPMRAGMNVAELFNDLNSMQDYTLLISWRLRGLMCYSLCLPTASREFLERVNVPDQLKVIDFSRV